MKLDNLLTETVETKTMFLNFVHLANGSREVLDRVETEKQIPAEALEDGGEDFLYIWLRTIIPWECRAWRDGWMLVEIYDGIDGWNPRIVVLDEDTTVKAVEVV